MARKTGPHAKSDLAVYLDRRILELRHKKNQSEIATSCRLHKCQYAYHH